MYKFVSFVEHNWLSANNLAQELSVFWSFEPIMGSTMFLMRT